MSGKLTDADVARMVQHWFRMREAKPLPIPERPRRDPGAGMLVAAAIRGELQAHGYHEGVSFWSPRMGWTPCLSCGVPKPEVGDNGGWCRECDR